MGTVVIRADASAAIGTGHVMRCLAVGEALREDGHTVLFALAESTGAMEARLEGDGFPCRRLPGPAGGNDDLLALRGLIDAAGANAIMLDGYHFNERYRVGLRAAGRCVLAWDDLAATAALHADIVVNPAIHARRDAYGQIAADATLLLGPTYAPLRAELRRALTAPRLPFAERRGILLTFGGSDPLGLTAPCIERLAPALPEDAHLIVAVGGSNPRRDTVLEMANRFGGRVTVHVDTPHMGAIMAGSGLAVSAGGGTMAELVAFGVPTLLVVVADNQAPAATEVARRGWCAVLDARAENPVNTMAARALALWADEARRRAMFEQTAGLVDGEGAIRIARALTQKLQCTS